MSLIAVIGQDQAQDGRVAGSRAAQKALSKLGRMTPVLGLVIASFDYSIQSIASGVSEQLGDTPLLGFNTMAEYTPAGLHRHTVAVAVLAGSDIQARADWWPGFTGDGSESQIAVQRMLQAFPPDPGNILLFVADGLSADAGYLVSQLKTGIFDAGIPNPGIHPTPPAGIVSPVFQAAGCLSPGDSSLQRSTQIGGVQPGSAGLAAALISGRLALGTGVGHAWFPIGIYFRVTRSTGRRIERLDEQPTVEAYARMFGQEPKAWEHSPLNEMVRLYPLGVEYDPGSPPGDPAGLKDRSLLVRVPVQFEGDGSLRMITSVPQDSYAHLLVGSAESCLDSARMAVSQAQQALARTAGQVKPVLAVAWVDASYQKLLEAHPGSEFHTIHSMLGPEVPILGAYTFGQVACPSPAGLPELLNGHVQILLFAQPAG